MTCAADEICVDDGAGTPICRVATPPSRIAGLPEALDDLIGLVRDDRLGREMVGRSSVNHRTRAFAAYGIPATKVIASPAVGVVVQALAVAAPRPAGGEVAVRGTLTQVDADLVEDPDELRSVYDDPEYAEVQAALAARLAERLGAAIDAATGVDGTPD